MTDSFIDRVKPAWTTTYSEVVPYVQGVSPPVADGQVFVDQPRFPRGVATQLGIVDYSGVRRGDYLIYTTSTYPSDYIDRLHHKFAALPVIVNTPPGPVIGYATRFHNDHGPIFVEVEDARPGVTHSYPLREVRPATREDLRVFAGYLTDHLKGSHAVFENSWDGSPCEGSIEAVVWNDMKGRYAAEITLGQWTIPLDEIATITLKEKAPVVEEPLKPQETETTGPGLRFTRDQPEDFDLPQEGDRESELLFMLDKDVFDPERARQVIFERFMLLNESARYANLEIVARDSMYTITGEPYAMQADKVKIKFEVDTSGVEEALEGLSDRLKTLEPLQEPVEGIETLVEGLSPAEAAQVLGAAQNGVLGDYTPASLDKAIEAVEAATDTDTLAFGALHMPKDLWEIVLSAWPEDVVASLRARFPLGPDDRISFRLGEIPKAHFLSAMRAIKDYVVSNELLGANGDPPEDEPLTEEEKAEQVVAVMPGIALLALLTTVECDAPAYPSEIRAGVGFVDEEFLAALIDNVEQEGLIRFSEDRDFEGAYELTPAGAVITTLNELSLEDAKNADVVQGFSLVRIAEAGALSTVHTARAIEALLERGFVKEVEGPSTERLYGLDV